MVQTAMVNAAPRRVLSVDALRGMTVAFMILVNDPGDWGHVYPQLDHAEWSGWTLTDLVFPNFLFLMGAALIFSLQGRMARGASKASLAWHIVRRAALIAAIQLSMGLYPHFHMAHLRLYGVLMRIALCYLAAGLLCLVTMRMRRLLVIVVGLLVGFWMLMRFVPVPGFGVPTHDVPLLDHDRNLAAWIDRGLMGFLQRTIGMGRLYRRTNDPEGLLSTLPAVATVLMGSVVGLWMRAVGYTAVRKRNVLAVAGALCVLAGEVWGRSFPINKNLWTSSYVLLAGGISLLGLALMYTLVDLKVDGVRERSRVARALLWPWLVFGSNALVAFIVSEFLVETLAAIKVDDGGKAITAWGWIYLHGFSHGGSTALTSLAFAVAYVAVCFLPNWLLWRKQIFVRI